MTLFHNVMNCCITLILFNVYSEKLPNLHIGFKSLDSKAKRNLSNRICSRRVFLILFSFEEFYRFFSKKKIQIDLHTKIHCKKVIAFFRGGCFRGNQFFNIFLGGIFDFFCLIMNFKIKKLILWIQRTHSAIRFYAKNAV